MADWRDFILKEFTPGVQPILVVADPDGLLREPRLAQMLAEKGFESLLFEETISFRFAYESRIRPRLDAGSSVDLVVLCGEEAPPSRALPFDILSGSRRLSFALTDVFPQFSYGVLRHLEAQYLEQLYEAQVRFAPGVLGENATKDFILRHVFEVAPELIQTDVDLLRMLLQRHYRFDAMPEVFLERLVYLLRQMAGFVGWPLKELIENRSSFFVFLQERWPLFLSRLAGTSLTHDPKFAMEGPAEIPFDSPDVRVYIDNYFVEGFLRPVDWHSVPAGWAAVGVKRDIRGEQARRLNALADVVDRDLPADNARHRAWMSFARVWAELNLLVCERGSELTPAMSERVGQLREQVDTRFAGWIQRSIGGLSSLPATSPVMVHHIPRFLSNLMVGAGKIALVVVDGLAYDQWLVVREELSKLRPGWRFDEGAVFAWVPTITSVSRQAIFSGKAPMFFPSSIYSTDREASLWQQFWLDHGLNGHEVTYLKGLGERAGLPSVEDALVSSKIRVVGAVVDKVDRIMHGMELGAAGMHNQVRQWAREGFLVDLLDLLFSRGFSIVLTADHGNVEAVGCGRPKEAMTADLRGERARIYSDAVLRDGVGSKFPTAIAWNAGGLPVDFLPLLAGGRTAFVLEGSRTVAHGGVTLEESIVPLVQIVGGSS
jgi:hypothetical protein